MGVTGVWFSPLTENILQGNHGYCQTEVYAIKGNFGSEEDLKDLSAALPKKSMYPMVDIVIKHIGSNNMHPPDDIGFTIYNPLDDPKYFRPYRAIDYDYQTSAEQGWLFSNLPDTGTEAQEVVDAYSTWIAQPVVNCNVDGLQIDSKKDVDKASMPQLCEAAGVHCLGELSNNDPACS
jgi:alpha-amylase